MVTEQQLTEVLETTNRYDMFFAEKRGQKIFACLYSKKST